MTLPRTPETLALIEQQIIENHGDITLAARTLFVSPIDIHQWMLADPEVAQTLQNAQRYGWMGLEAEAIRRATGYDEEVWFQGEMVGHKRVYSDGLLQTLLKARVAGHREDNSLQRPMVQINVMPRASTYEEWQEQRQITLSKDHDDSVSGVSDAARQAYSLMKQPEDAVFEEVTNGLPDWL